MREIRDSNIKSIIEKLMSLIKKSLMNSMHDNIKSIDINFIKSVNINIKII